MSDLFDWESYWKAVTAGKFDISTDAEYRSYSKGSVVRSPLFNDVSAPATSGGPDSVPDVFDEPATTTDDPDTFVFPDDTSGTTDNPATAPDDDDVVTSGGGDGPADPILPDDLSGGAATDDGLAELGTSAIPGWTPGYLFE